MSALYTNLAREIAETEHQQQPSGRLPITVMYSIMHCIVMLLYTTASLRVVIMHMHKHGFSQK